MSKTHLTLKINSTKL